VATPELSELEIFGSEEIVSNCIFCGKPAGLFHNKHHECAEKHEVGRRQITNLILQLPSSPDSVGSVASRIKQVAEQSFISGSERNHLSVAAWSSAVDSSLHDGVPSEEVEKRLVDLKEGLAFSSGDLLQTDAWDRMAKSAVLRDLLNGVIPKRMRFDENLPLNFQKGEQVVWAFDQCDYLEEKTRRQYVGRSRGVSVRIMKGVYCHIGEFKGHPIDRTERVHVDTGLVAVTTKQIYFSGTTKAFRVPYTKIVSFEPFSNGVGIMRDAASAKPQILITHDGWFTYNLVTNLARL
jgi:hypothetical protein